MNAARTEMWAAIAPVHGAILDHPFVRGMTSGGLPEEAFARYIVQDALYLADYARALALCGARAADTPTLRMFCAHAGEAVEAERALQDGLLTELGVGAQELAAARPTPTTRAYGDFLIRACSAGERHEALGAIVPCYWIYAEVGRHLVAAGSPDGR
ncbi:MAG: TenA family protein [Miltoncostaeaceae bacterium]